jgi:hypothetical protein
VRLERVAFIELIYVAVRDLSTLVPLGQETYVRYNRLLPRSMNPRSLSRGSRALLTLGVAGALTATGIAIAASATADIPAFGVFSATATPLGTTPIVPSNTAGPNTEVKTVVILRTPNSAGTTSNIHVGSTLPTGAIFIGNPAFVAQGGGPNTIGTCSFAATTFSCNGGIIGGGGNNIIVTTTVSLTASFAGTSFTEPFDPVTNTTAAGPGSADITGIVAVPVAPGSPPVETVIAPADGVTYFQGQTVASSFSCAPGTSPGSAAVTSCTGTVPNGSAFDTATTGAKSFSVTATDANNFTSTTTVHYKVAAVAGVCRATPISVTLLGVKLAPGTANPATTPCASDAKQVVTTNIVLTPAIPLLEIAANSVSLGALSGLTEFAPAIGAGGTASQAQIAGLTISLLGISIKLTGLSSEANVHLTSCGSAAVVNGSSSIETLTINGKDYSPSANSGHLVTISLGVATLTLNEHNIVGNTITQSALHLSVPGVADLALGQTVAGATCAS